MTQPGPRLDVKVQRAASRPDIIDRLDLPEAMTELSEQFRQAMQVQAGAKVLYEALEATRVESALEDSEVKVILNGNCAPIQVVIPESLMTSGAEVVAAHTLVAYRGAYQQAYALMRREMQELTQDLKVPDFSTLDQAED
jgi:DNA-binding protein YbaB